MRVALVHEASKIVVNVLELDVADIGDAAAPDGYALIRDEPPSCGPGWTLDGDTRSPPPVPAVTGAPPA